MSRTLSEIYTLTKETRDTYLELTEFSNSSKMSVLDAFTWVVSACVWAHENIMDVFKVDLAAELNNRINGTPAYYANALLKYQSGDELVMSEDGTSFSYATTDESKRVITKVSYSEIAEENFNDKTLLLKIAKGEPGNYARIDDDELLKIRAYLNNLLFAGQHAYVASRTGDVLVPKVTVYYDGQVEESDVFANIKTALNNFIANISFDGAVYSNGIIDAIQSAEHVTDVQIENDATDEQGIFIAQYDDDNNIILDNSGSKLQRIGRYFIPNSGYIKESTGSGLEADIPDWSQSIILKLEDKE